jgi:5-methylcytosine-specific restriction endonuclease McrA
MTDYQKFKANEKRDEIFRRDHYTCQICGKSVYEGIPQLAHRIAATKSNISKYGREVIYHSLNMVSVESLYCNSRCNIGNRPIETEKLVQDIRNAIKKPE